MELKLLGNSIQLKHRNKDELYILPVDKEKIVGTIKRQVTTLVHVCVYVHV